MAGVFYEISPGYGYCLNIEDAHNTIRAYQQQTQNRYCVHQSARNFGNIDVRLRPRKVFWEDDQKNKVIRECLMFDGVPFHILGKKVLYCEYGNNKNVKKIKDEHGNKVEVHPATTKKVGCPALIYMKEVIKYPAYMIQENSDTARSSMAEKLRNDYNEGKAEGQRRIYILFPNVKEHENHVVVHDGKLVKPEDIPCDDINIIQSEIELTPVDSLSEQVIESTPANNAQCCRSLIEELQKNIDSNLDDPTMLGTAEMMLKSVLDYVTTGQQNPDQVDAT